MPALKYWDEPSLSYKEIFSGQKGDKGDKGDQGDPGQDGAPGGYGPLDDLQDVTAPASTPAGKVLGTTATGAWEPIDPPPTGLSQATADTLYVNVAGDTMTGALIASHLESAAGVKAMGPVTDVAAPAAGSDATNKTYVDSRIWTGTQAQYDAIGTKDPAVLYVIVP